MKLRGQLILSHLGTIVLTALAIGLFNIVLLMRGTRAAELELLGSSLASSTQLIANRVATLQRARDEVAALALSLGPLDDSVATLSRLHELLDLHRVERVEVFTGLRREAVAYRWERGVGRDLETEWFPPRPQVAALIVSRRPVLWIQHDRGGRASLKSAAPVPGSSGRERRWVVVTEPLDGVFLQSVLPPEMSGALRSDGRVLLAWPEATTLAPERLDDLLSDRSWARLTGPLAASRRSLPLDGDAGVELVLVSSGGRTGRSLVQGLRIWFLVAFGGALAALAIGSGLARRLLAPLNVLLEGTAAMARGHLMVRLPVDRADELGSLTREFNRMADEIRNTYLGVISTLAEVVEAKSHYTRQHIERVEGQCLATADILEKRGWVRFSSHQRFLLSVAAILHDVGKIAISNEILNKRGPLDSSEREQILSHPEAGALIVERMGKLERAAEIIRCAHEHFDGSGYPQGLAGDEIPLESRIILAVDAFDAMTMDRPYSVGRPLEAAIAELRAEAGHQFDPVVVEALIEVVSGERNGDLADSSDSGLYRVLQPADDSRFSSRRSRASQE
ncbi:MAG: HD-GYP domain-containing protein [Acidobacteriota bacterium]